LISESTAPGAFEKILPDVTMGSENSSPFVTTPSTTYGRIGGVEDRGEGL
jgi:hypothetical protein